MNICYSGGAKGADTLFGECAKQVGHQVIHYTKKDLSPAINVIADQALLLANTKLKRTYPTNKESVNNLLRRNYLQIQSTDCVYAVTRLDSNYLPLGGTAWAVVMAMNIGVPNVYMYDMTCDLWFQHNGLYISCVKIQDIPKPTGEYTGIGARDLTENGVKAIKQLYFL